MKNYLCYYTSIFEAMVLYCFPPNPFFGKSVKIYITKKGYDSYSDAISFIRTKISFALLRSSVLWLRGCRALKRQIDHAESSIAATVHEGRLS